MLKIVSKIGLLLTICSCFYMVNQESVHGEEKQIREAIAQQADSYNEKVCKNILIINKIGLKKCMNGSSVDQDVVVLYDGNTIVIAGHSGTGKTAYFKNLYKLEMGDSVILYHNGKRNEYIVSHVSDKEKEEKLAFSDVSDQLILITCSYQDKTKQLVYFLYKNA